MKAFEHTVTSEKPFEETVLAIEKKSAESGFRVLHTHDVAATLAEKGLPREPLKIIAICNAKYASEVLKKDVKISLMLGFAFQVPTTSRKDFSSQMVFQPDMEWKRGR